jgi:hypothetical protein
MNTKASVFHLETLTRSLPAFNLTTEKLAEVRSDWAAGNYHHVADIEVATKDIQQALDVVFENTNHIDHNWTEKPGVTLKTADGCRSTSTSDIILIDGKFYLCMSCGWEEIIPYA